MKWLNNLKAKWNIQSNFQLVIIFIVFGITGTLSVEVRDPILDFIGLKKEVMNPWIFIPLKLL
ncbi:MAG: diacylglyceryl transferase, partial [Flavobacteriales bacterium]|nr:diacylglyceryl transferase [Flavobacteriales bacterium]